MVKAKGSLNPIQSIDAGAKKWNQVIVRKRSLVDENESVLI